MFQFNNLNNRSEELIGVVNPISDLKLSLRTHHLITFYEFAEALASVAFRLPTVDILSETVISFTRLVR